MSVILCGRAHGPLKICAAALAVILSAGAGRAASLASIDAVLDRSPLGVSDAPPAASAGGAHDAHDDGLFAVFEAADMPAGLAATAAQADMVNTREAALDAIYGQQSVLATLGEPIDIRFNDVIQIEAPSLTRISSSDELSSLFGLTDPLYSQTGVNLTVSVYYVDAIDYCGGYNAGIVGCGQTPGNQLAVETAYMNSSYGAELLAHELGHTLGLGHSGEAPLRLSGANLMSPSLNRNTTLVDLQVAQFMAMGVFGTFNPTPLVQRDVAGLFVSITPYLIVQEAVLFDPGNGGGGEPGVSRVPVPGAGLLLLAGLAGLAGLGGAGRPGRSAPA